MLGGAIRKCGKSAKEMIREGKATTVRHLDKKRGCLIRKPAERIVKNSISLKFTLNNAGITRKWAYDTENDGAMFEMRN